MRNSDDAKLIAGAIEKAGRLISEVIKENTRLTAQRTPRYQIPERANEQIVIRDSIDLQSFDKTNRHDLRGTAPDITQQE